MTMLSSPAVTVEVLRRWDETLMQTAALQPRGSARALIRYAADPWPEEGGLPMSLVSALAAGLVHCGRIAGRWFDDAPPPSQAVPWPPASRTLFARTLERVRRTEPALVVATEAPTVVAALLDQGWHMQAQALLVCARGTPDQADEAFAALSTLRDWTGFTFPAPARALVVPGVDGDVVLIAARSEQALSAILASLHAAFTAAGIIVSPNQLEPS